MQLFFGKLHFLHPTVRFWQFKHVLLLHKTKKKFNLLKFYDYVTQEKESRVFER